jgi:hypothetical protein
MARYSKSDRAEAIARLREWIKSGDTVYTILDHVSRSGMSRRIRVVIPQIERHQIPSVDRKTGKELGGLSLSDPKVDFIHPNHAVAAALGLSQAKQGDGLIVGGCGMDMGFHLVHSLSYAIYPEYDCTGDNCPSPEHQNARSRRQCECGHEHYNHEVIDATSWDDAKQRGRCEVGGCDCQQFREIPSADHRGPGVKHRDGYALRHRWL